jgi:hypothetical protein
MRAECRIGGGGAKARRLTTVAFGLAFAIAAEASGQAICSAPHSSPMLTQSGAIRTLPAGAGWWQVSLYGQESREGFDPFGRRQPFLADATFSVRSVFITAALGVTDGLEVWVQTPFHRLTVDGDGGASRSTGVGDLRAAVRVSPALLGLEIPVALRVGRKVPGSDFPVLATELPLSEGQVDWEVSAESGWVADAVPLYVVGWIGHRWRARNAAGDHEPGDERFAHAALGGQAGAISWEVGVDGLWGSAPFESGLTLPSAARRLIQVLPTLGSDLGPGRLEATMPIPVSGRNLPAGLGLSIGYRTLFGG